VPKTSKRYWPEAVILEPRKILSMAALFDGEFNIDWLQELTGKKASQIFAAMEFGVTNRWLVSNGSLNFSFIDPLEQQKLKDFLSSDEKKTMHRSIADLLLRNVPDGIDTRIRVAHHLLYLSNDIDGCRILIENGDIHRKEFSDDVARLYYGKAIDDLRAYKGNKVERLFIKAALQYAKVSANNTDPNRVILIMKEAIRRAKSSGDKDSVGLLEMHLGKSEWLCSRGYSALRHFKKGLVLAQEIDNPTTQRSATIFGIFFYYWSGHYREVIQSYETFVPEVEDTFPKDNLPLQAALTAGLCLGHAGLYSQALGMMHTIRERSRSIGDLSMTALAGITIGYLLLELHRPEDSIECLEGSLDEAIKSHNLYAHLAGLLFFSYASHLVGDNKQAVSALREYRDLSSQSRMTMRFTPVWMWICWAMEEGRFPLIEGLSMKEEIDYSIRSGNLLMKGVAYRYKALMQRKENPSGDSFIDDLKRSAAFLQVCGHQIELAKSKMEVAREYCRLGNEKKAIEWAEPAAKTLYLLNDALVPDDIRLLIKDLCYGDNLVEEILRLSQELPTIRDYKDLSRLIISTINRITGAERGAIFLLEDQNPGKIVLRAAKTLTSEDITLPGFETSMRLIEDTAKTGEGHILELDTQEQSGSTETNGIRSCICVPMTIRNKVMGVLYHDNRLFRSTFKESDLKILDYFAAQAAIAIDNAQAWKTLNELYEKQQLEKQYYEQEYLKTIHFEDFVGKSPAIIKVFNQVKQVAETDATVLILGETGVGKELIARSVHSHSPRNQKPFIRVQCSALSETLISSELFGHEKGAFTGATTRHMGRFELANGGTIFLDEIGDISMDIQVRLLRVLQSGEFERVGGHETLQSDFRLLAATNRDLQREVSTGHFRQDLYYRLNVFPIDVPRLRDRNGDVPLLAYYFLKLYANKFNKPLKSIPEEEMNKLLTYHWPGNVRELEHVVERGVILSDGPYFKVPQLEGSYSISSSEQASLSLRDNERNHIIRVLKKTGGRVAGTGGAADILDINPNTLFSRMKRLGIQRQAHYVSRIDLNPQFQS